MKAKREGNPPEGGAAKCRSGPPPMPTQPCHGGELAELEGDAHADNRPERADEDAGHARDAEPGRHRGERQGGYPGSEIDAGTATRPCTSIVRQRRRGGKLHVGSVNCDKSCNIAVVRDCNCCRLP